MSDPNIILADPWHHANPQYGGADALALEFVKKREEIVARIQADMAEREPKEESTAVMLESEVTANISEQNARYAQGALKREVLHSYYNHPLILGDFKNGRGRNLDPGSGKGPALIIGSGPTLDECHDLIRGWKGAIFCSTSQGMTMLGLGKSKFLMTAVDAKTEAGEFTPLAEWENKGVTLITHPGMDPSVIQAWRWDKRYFRIIVQQMPFYSQILPVAYPMIRTTLYVYGCAVSAQVSQAALMGYNPLFLCGCDFGYPRGRARFRSLAPKDGKWDLSEPFQAKYMHHAKVIYRNGCESDSFQAYYKQTFFNVWRLSLADCFVVGDEGGLYEVPHVSPKEVLDSQGDGLRDRFISNRDKEDICERYLLQYGTYTFEYPNGQVEFCVFAGGDAQIPEYVAAVNAALERSKSPGVLYLGEVKAKLEYLRNDAAWEAKEKRWQWAIRSPQSQTETPSEKPSESA